MHVDKGGRCLQEDMHCGTFWKKYQPWHNHCIWLDNQKKAKQTFQFFRVCKIATTYTLYVAVPISNKKLYFALMIKMVDSENAYLNGDVGSSESA